MAPKREQWLRRIKAVDREHAAARLALDRLVAAIINDPTVLTADLRVRDVAVASDRLVATYLIRLVAEFEAGLREFWATVRTTQPPLRDLLDGVAAMRRVPDQTTTEVHAVRSYRNSLVHQRDDGAMPVTIATAQEHLCSFFSRMPTRW